jgi:hypothetical protein
LGLAAGSHRPTLVDALGDGPDDGACAVALGAVNALTIAARAAIAITARRPRSNVRVMVSSVTQPNASSPTQVKRENDLVRLLANEHRDQRVSCMVISRPELAEDI